MTRSVPRSLVAICSMAVAVLGCALIGACHSAGNPMPPLRVVARLGDADFLPAGPQLPISKAKLGASTRSALVLHAGEKFEATIGPDRSRLLFSIGLRLKSAVGLPPRKNTAAEGSKETEEYPPVAFAVDARVDDRWVSVFSEVIRADRPEWQDRSVDLRSVPGAVALRFRTTVADSGTELEVLWGAIVLMGSGRDDVAEPDTVLAPNVVLISLDTLSARHLSGYGGAKDVSPNIDRLFRRAHRFTRAYATYGNTLVSHASLFTGLYPKHHGVYEETPELHSNLFAKALAENGYLTVAITEDAYVGSDFGFDRGFDWFDNGVGEKSGHILPNGLRTFTNAKSWLKEYGSSTQFFLFVHTYEAHSPYHIHDERVRNVVDRLDPGYKGRFVDGLKNDWPIMRHNAGREELPAADLRHLEALYDGGISYLDRIVGDFIDYLERLPIKRRTLVVLISDHGEEFGDHKTLGHGHSLYDDVLRVPMAFFWPGHIEPGSESTIVQLTDVFPTVLELLQLEIPNGLDGRSLVPSFDGGKLSERPAYAEMISTPFIVSRDRLEEECISRGFKKPDCRQRALSVESDKFKLISNDSEGTVELYNLSSDPRETKNLAKKFPDEVAGLRSLLKAYAAQTPRVVHDSTPSKKHVIDKATEERLKALGYMQ